MLLVTLVIELFLSFFFYNLNQNYGSGFMSSGVKIAASIKMLALLQMFLLADAGKLQTWKMVQCQAQC